MGSTSYGTWQNFVSGDISVRAGIDASLGIHTNQYDMDAIEQEYRDLVNAKLKDTGIVLSGDAFTGPAEDCKGCREAAPQIIAEAIEQANVDFWKIVAKHEKNED